MRKSMGGGTSLERAMRPNLMASAVWRWISDTAREKINLAPIRLTISILIPLAALALQWELWPWIRPFVWFFFFPAVFLSARIGGLRGGIPATVFSILLVWYFFIPPQFSWHIENPNNYWSMVVFLLMGWLFSDVQERLIRAYKHIEQNNTELKAVNKELEAFSYSVSHDLRTPLRAIDGFSRILLKHHASDLAPEPREYLQAVRDNTVQMGHLVDDLLAFARLNRKQLSKRQVPTRTIVEQVVREIQQQAEGRCVSVSIGDLPPVWGDAALLKQVFVNLVDNAFKYTRLRQDAAVEIGSRTIGGERVFFVRDNGAGFDMQYTEKLFGVFQRLHRAEDFEGTGVGLAIVQRIVHRHGGRIWAEAAVNQGAAFYFTTEVPNHA